jgi:hypothetical protein
MAVLIDQGVYERWLARKAAAHARRDRKRGNSQATIEAYKHAIHQAVELSGGLDAYTGEQLGWNLVSTYSNEESKIGRRYYKASLGLLPTVDHVGDGSGPADFRICAWRTNAAKNDSSHVDFVELCRRVVEYHGRMS